MSRDQDRVQRFHSGGPWETEVGYSRAVRVGDRVLLSGTTAARGDDEPVPDDAGEQARLAFETIGVTLEHAGAKLDDVVRCRIFVVDIARNGDAVLEVYRDALRRARPTVSTLGVAGLVDPSLLVEIEVEAIAGAGDVYEG